MIATHDQVYGGIQRARMIYHRGGVGRGEETWLHNFISATMVQSEPGIFS
jgi:hypothetical protein